MLNLVEDMAAIDYPVLQDHFEVLTDVATMWLLVSFVAFEQTYHKLTRKPKEKQKKKKEKKERETAKQRRDPSFTQEKPSTDGL